MKTQSEKMTTFASKHWGVLERMVAGVKRRQELETENELIKHAKETTITCLTTLQKKFETVSVYKIVCEVYLKCVEYDCAECGVWEL